MSSISSHAPAEREVGQLSAEERVANQKEEEDDGPRLTPFALNVSQPWNFLCHEMSCLT